MRLKEIKIRNFRSYYGNDNIFELSPGLTLILGDNSDGKTTFFEALEWLFYTATEDKSEANISEKRKSELVEGEEDTVSVTLSFDHDGEKELIKSYVFKKGTNNSVLTYGYKFVGYETIGAERVQVDGKRLLERCFDTIIRKYCLFKGESELNIFNGSTALNSLVDTFSDVRKFKEYVDMTTDFENKNTASGIFKTMFTVMRHNGALDWNTPQVISMNNVANRNQIEFHHIFPQDFLKGKYERDEINDIANQTFIVKRTNVLIKNDDPAVYLPEVLAKKGKENFKKHCIPTDASLWNISKYPEFIAKRRQLLTDMVNNYLKELD